LGQGTVAAVARHDHGSARHQRAAGRIVLPSATTWFVPGAIAMIANRPALTAASRRPFRTGGAMRFYGLA
jgi:hypothetical protein